MKRAIAGRIGLVGLGMVISAGAAQAQVIYGVPPAGHVAPPGYDAGLPPNEILMLVRAQGLSPLTRPARRGHRYLLLASDYVGGQFHVVVNAYNGRVLRVIPAYDPRFAYGPARPQAMIPEPSARGLPLPQAAPPPPARNPQSPMTEQTKSAAPETASPRSPARTPLPRPRPTVAANEAQAVPPSPPRAAAAPVAPRTAQPTAPAQSAPSQPQPPNRAITTGQTTPRAPTELVPVAPLD